MARVGPQRYRKEKKKEEKITEYSLHILNDDVCGLRGAYCLMTVFVRGLV
jgi:hypothetical protein